MRAMLCWDVDPHDLDIQRIIFDLASLLPPERTQRLTTWTALVDPITAGAFRTLARQLDALAKRYQDRLFFTFSLHPAGAVIWGNFRQPGATLLASDDTLGFGPGSGIPED